MSPVVPLKLVHGARVVILWARTIGEHSRTAALADIIVPFVR
jgi:hypothetical protein